MFCGDRDRRLPILRSPGPVSAELVATRSSGVEVKQNETAYLVNAVCTNLWVAVSPRAYSCESYQRYSHARIS